MDKIDISSLDPVLKNYVFSSYFMSRLIDRTVKENDELKLENARLKAEIGEYAGLKQKFDELF